MSEGSWKILKVFGEVCMVVGSIALGVVRLLQPESNNHGDKE